MISLLLPSRGRPHNLYRFLSSARAHAGDKDYEVVVRLDEDDVALVANKIVASIFEAKVLVGPRSCLSDLWSECAVGATGDPLWLQDDEVLFISHNWVSAVKDHFAIYTDGFLVAGADESHGGDHYCCPIISRRWYEVTGHTYPFGFDGDWGDVWIGRVAHEVNRRTRVPGLVINQLAAAKGQAPQDATCLERQERQKAADIHQQFQDRRGERTTEVQRLREAIRVANL